ncbi:hypothetical protein B1812_10835 [Methylocystis bryophila]|uniref:Acyltransferase 3 domain-containing protein n=2 Tax=Methylocystis bryophila TaxID=655015 RepID=A0A1W6MV71_9HYPH|nr:hypothetical protein B1812_10835 [Methylocystis bryophila]
MSTPRLPAIEALRVIAAIGIVWFHSGAPGHEFAYTGLSFFLIVSLYFETRRALPINSVLQNAVTRYIIPWFFWFLFYGIFRLAAHVPFFPPSYGSAPPLLKILAGTSIHLWYIPYVVLITITMSIAINLTSRKIVFACSTAAFFIVIPWISFGWIPGAELYPPLPQYIQALPAALLGIMFGSSQNGSLPRSFVIALLAALLIAGWTCPLAFGFQDALAAVLLLGALATRSNTQGSSSLRILSRLTYGVYLVHPFFLSVSRKLLSSSDTLVAVYACTASFGATWVAQRYATRFYDQMEPGRLALRLVHRLRHEGVKNGAQPSDNLRELVDSVEASPTSSDECGADRR